LVTFNIIAFFVTIQFKFAKILNFGKLLTDIYQQNHSDWRSWFWVVLFTEHHSKGFNI